MQSTIFQYSYEQVFKTTRSALSSMGFIVKNFDKKMGTIRAKRGFSFAKPSMDVDLVIESLENDNTKITVNSSSKRLFFQKKKSNEEQETHLIEVLSILI